MQPSFIILCPKNGWVPKKKLTWTPIHLICLLFCTPSGLQSIYTGYYHYLQKDTIRRPAGKQKRKSLNTVKDTQEPPSESLPRIITSGGKAPLANQQNTHQNGLLPRNFQKRKVHYKKLGRPHKKICCILIAQLYHSNQMPNMSTDAKV